MPNRRGKRYTLYVPGNETREFKRDPEVRAMRAARFKVLCADAGLNVEQVAQTLHVTPRTVRYWFSGKTAVPFAAYKLLRILNRFELPGRAWSGWLFHSGKLWTPEGFAFEPQDAAWWSLVVRQARSFRTVYAQLGEQVRELAAVRAELDEARASSGAADGGTRASGAARSATPPSNTGVNGGVTCLAVTA